MKHITLVLLLFASLTAKSQAFCELGFGSTNGFFSGELQAGYRLDNYNVSVGYIAMPNNTMPAHFNARAGMVLAERFWVYGGYVREMYSFDDKSRNSNTWQAGLQVGFIKYDKGTMYVGANYTGTQYLSLHVGFSYNLFKERE
jgi:hypothetical protein